MDTNVLYSLNIEIINASFSARDLFSKDKA